MTVSDDRWTCPSCGRSVVIIGSQADVRCAIEACQRRHADGHRRAAEVLARLPLPELPRPRRGRRDQAHRHA
ncbi:MAG: hypothetical protein HOV66_27855 [Streptomycetaceae bacterium]|nr:hypothetical protein [Streptomycetaceae bacterium]